MEERTLQTLLAAQVLTLAAALETLSKVKEKNVVTDWEREAAKLINRRQTAVLQLLDETRLHP
jgi:hypothetical protein